jgi:heme exporter protein B
MSGAPSSARQYRALVLKDLRLELRTRETLIAMVLFVVIAMVILQFGFGTRETDLTRFAGGLLWVPLAFAAVLGVGRSYVAEREQRVLDGLLVAPVSRFVLLLSRATAIVGYLLAVEIVAVPLLGVFFVKGPYWGDVGWIFLACLLADVGIGLLGTLVASMAVFTRARELVMPVVFLPLLVPVVIAAAGATHAVVGQNDMAQYRDYCLFLAGFAVLFGLVAYATFDAVFDD